MYRYAEVEAALAKLHDVTPAGLGAFKGRIIHFQRIGLGPSNPGRGKKIQYSLEDVLTWSFCLQLSEFGIDPKQIQAIYQSASLAINLGLFQESEGDDAMFFVTPMIMSAAINGEADAAPVLQLPFTTDQIPDQYIVARASKVDLKGIGRAIVINLSRLRRRVIEELGHEDRITGK